MNKSIALSLIIFMGIFTLTACGAKTNPSIPPDQKNSQYRWAAQWAPITPSQKDGFSTATGASNRK